VNLPDGLALPVQMATATDDVDVLVGFVVSRDDLDKAEKALAAARPDQLAWIAFPKGGKLGTHLNRDILVNAASAHGLQPVRQVSIDDTWSALRFRPSNT
jgi:hypothetical protein